MPPATPEQLKEWTEDVAAFDKANPNITIDGGSGPVPGPGPVHRHAQGGTEPNVFYAYFTDLDQVLDTGQAADITSYVNDKTVPALADIVPTS